MNKGSVYRVAWENQQAHASSCDEVDALLNRLVTEYQGDKAVFVTITRTATGDSLKLGVGRERTVLDYVPGDLEPPYHASLGDPNESGSLVFRYEGEWTEVPARNAVPWKLGLEAVRHFCNTGELLKNMQWEMD